MGVLRIVIVTMVLIAMAGTAVPSRAAEASAPVRQAERRSGNDLGRQTLDPNDGWAAAQGGTTGGAAATDEHVYIVSTWEALRAALGGSTARGDTTPRIVYIHGEIAANSDPQGNVLTCEDYAAGTGYSL